MIWTPYDCLNKGYSLYMTAVVIIGGGHGLRVEAHRGNQPNSTSCCCISRYFHFNFFFKQPCTSNKMEHFGYKGGCDVHGLTCIEAFKRRSGLGYR